MTTNNKPVLVYGTFASAEEAHRIGSALVEARLAACVNILAPIRSIYVWQGNREEASETPMLIKTTTARSEAVVARVKALHSYDNPAIVLIPIEGGSPEFLAWIAAQTQPD